MSESYVPERGDLIWLDFNPQKGLEQSGRRPALVISPFAYNQKTRLALCCPVTSAKKGYPFEVELPEKQPISGVILSDHVKNLDWKSRQATFISRVPKNVINDTIGKLSAILRLE